MSVKENRKSEQEYEKNGRSSIRELERDNQGFKD